MLELSLTTARCKAILVYVLKKHSLTLPRVARAIAMPVEYVRKVEACDQSFQLADVEALSRVCGIQTHELIFNSIDPSKLSARKRGLYDLGVKQIGLHLEMQRLLAPKPSKKRRVRTSAA